MIELYHTTCSMCSKITTVNYSTSFAKAIKLLDKTIQQDIYNVYGFVRLADEIVDTFHAYDQQALLEDFRLQTYKAVEHGISLNPILHSFQHTVNKYSIDLDLINAFFKSMQFDLTFSTHDETSFNEYVYGSAEVVGLMCLYIFCEGDHHLYQNLKPFAQRLGAAFQKVNFLRDIKSDYIHLNRVYFQNCDFLHFTEKDKLKIELEIKDDFQFAYEGIKQLPVKARFGVYIAYKYYEKLFQKIKKLKPGVILEKRVRIPDYNKLLILVKASVSRQFKLI